MFKKCCIVLLVSAVPFTASANELIAGADFYSIGSLNAVVGSLGYPIDLESLDNQRVVVGGRYGIGFGDDNGVEMDSLLGLFAKYQYDFGNNWYAQGIAAYTRFEYSYDYNGVGFNFSGSGSDSEFTIGGGGGYKFSEQSAVEANIELFDYDTALTVGYRYSF